MIDPKLIILAVSAIAGGSVAIEQRYVDEPEFARHVAENERGFILDVVSKTAAVEPGPYKTTLCDTLEKAIGRLCDAAPDDSICKDRNLFRSEAGCPRSRSE